jgi:5-methylcytosine-specific restriction endonuclease McrA
MSYKVYKSKERKRKEKARANELKGKKKTSKKRASKLKALPSWRERYIDYLKSPEWKTTRLRALRTWGDACQLCGSKERIEVHHRTYARLTKEKMEDLMVVCHSCHEKIHERAF